jgi:DNA-binding transcriptional ArsR family regulator
MDLSDVLDADLFRALCEPNRLSILSWLAQEGETTVSGVAASSCCDLSLSVVSRHLKSLREADVLEVRRSGKEVHYSVPIARIAGRLRAIADALEACCPDGDCVVALPTNKENP